MDKNQKYTLQIITTLILLLFYESVFSPKNRYRFQAFIH